MHDHTRRGEAGADHGVRAGARHRSRLLAAFFVIGAFFVVEVVGGLLTGSLALLSDAAHMFTDVLGLGMALAAVHAAGQRARSPQHTFGFYRLEVLAAAVNALMLFGVGLYVLYEAWLRLRNPPLVLTGGMLGVAVAGLVANLVAFALLREGSKESLNVQGAFLEVLADTLGSIGVIGAALVIRFTGWTLADPLVAAAIGCFVLPRTASLAHQALRMLMQHAPAHISVADVARRLAEIPGVESVHDLHVWTLTSEMDVASAHLRLVADARATDALSAAQQIMRAEFRLSHATIQIETREGECSESTW